MNRITLLFLFAFLYTFNCAWAQKPANPSIEWGSEFETERYFDITNIGFDESGYYMIANKQPTLHQRLLNGDDFVRNSDTYFHKIDKNLNEVAKVEFVEKEKGSKIDYSFEYLKLTGNKLFLFKSSLDKDAKKNILYIQQLNKKTLRPEGGTMPISEIAYQDKSNSGLFKIYQSKAKSKLVILNILPSGDNKNTKLSAVMCDSNMKVLWKKNITLENPKALILEKLMCDDEGNIYILCKEEYKNMIKGESNFSYKMITYQTKEEEKTEFEISLKKKYISDISFFIDNKGHLSVGGFYTTNENFILSYDNAIDGIFYMSIDPVTKKVILSNEVEISTTTAAQDLNKRSLFSKASVINKGFGRYEMDIRNFVQKKDGGIILISEEVFFEKKNAYNASTGKVGIEYEYDFDDIYCISITPEGKIRCDQKISKKQHTNHERNSSFTSLSNDKKIYFIFNDRRENLAPKKEGVSKNTYGGLSEKNSIVSLTSLDHENGSPVREVLINLSEMELNLIPRSCMQINENQIILFAQVRKNAQYGIVTFE